ncbi:hypothetical protein ACV1C1_21440, partial [Aeromonas caviae]
AIKLDHKRSLFYIYFNWLALKILYMMVHYADTGKQDLLLSALGYLTKPDEQILATLPAGRRTFGRMEISVARPRGGRPRSVSYGTGAIQLAN